MHFEEEGYRVTVGSHINIPHNCTHFLVAMLKVLQILVQFLKACDDMIKDVTFFCNVASVTLTL